MKYLCLKCFFYIWSFSVGLISSNWVAMVFMVSNAIRSSLNVLLTGFLLILPSWNPTWVLLLSSLLALAILTIQACTPYLGRFWSGCAGKAKRGLEISGIEIIDLDLHICLHLEVVQTPVPSILETVCWTLIDWYLHCFTCAQRVPVEDNFLCGCRWVFFQSDFRWRHTCNGLSCH